MAVSKKASAALKKHNRLRKRASALGLSTKGSTAQLEARIKAKAGAKKKRKAPAKKAAPKRRRKAAAKKAPSRRRKSTAKTTAKRTRKASTPRATSIGALILKALKG